MTSRNIQWHEASRGFSATAEFLFVILLANPEDMARALLTNAIHNIASMTVWTALAKNSQTVYMCGGVFEHQLSRDLFTYIFEGLAYFHGKV